MYPAPKSPSGKAWGKSVGGKASTCADELGATPGPMTRLLQVEPAGGNDVYHPLHQASLGQP